tara:strand:- start:321 stop:503 length:183 start_codon:yes stop_codon:yes gene_type:complete
MMSIFIGIAKSLMSEWLMKRLAYAALTALADSSDNELAKETAFVVGQALGLEDKEDKYED